VAENRQHYSLYCTGHIFSKNKFGFSNDVATNFVAVWDITNS